MEIRSQIHWGSVPVPYAALWSGEEGKMRVEFCPHVRQLACCDAYDRGNGKPIFGKPHMGRQRELIANDLCDLCAKPLRLRTKVSLSHARPIASGANGMTIMQVEPLVHKDCAEICVQYCPSLKRDIGAGSLVVRQVIRHRHQFSVLTANACEEFTGKRLHNIVGHAKVELVRWVDRDLHWLTT